MAFWAFTLFFFGSRYPSYSARGSDSVEPRSTVYHRSREELGKPSGSGSRPCPRGREYLRMAAITPILLLGSIVLLFLSISLQIPPLSLDRIQLLNSVIAAAQRRITRSRCKSYDGHGNLLRYVPNTECPPVPTVNHHERGFIRFLGACKDVFYSRFTLYRLFSVDF